MMRAGNVELRLLVEDVEEFLFHGVCVLVVSVEIVNAYFALRALNISAMPWAMRASASALVGQFIRSLMLERFKKFSIPSPR